jgi:anthranilate synthase component I
LFQKTYFLDQFTPIALFDKLSGLYGGEVRFLLESAITNEYGNFSFIFIGAKERLVHKNGKTFFTDLQGKRNEVDKNPLEFLRKRFADQKPIASSPFAGGFVGLIGYDTIKLFEPTLSKDMDGLLDETNLPDVDLIYPKITLAYSHKNSTLHLTIDDISFEAELETLEKAVFGSYDYIPLKKAENIGASRIMLEEEKFKQRVLEAKENIRAGDVFQILISNRITQEASVDPLSYYRVLRAKNPSPYMYLLVFEEYSIAGSSPEVMIKLEKGDITIRPIAGTRKRGASHERDRELELEMLGDPKECAEHIMLVDLARNDIGRVSKTSSVKVDDLMRVEKYSHVMHMVSDVSGVLDDDKDMFDLFMATFTAGTMTGAPKIKAMELIAKYEGVKRGFYSGSVGYFGFDGNMDFAIAIRTTLITKDRLVFQAGAGVVADSDPVLEALEVRNKLAANKASFDDLTKLA